jgi:hypothetical protein
VPLLVEPRVNVTRGTFPEATLGVRLLVRPAAACTKVIQRAAIRMACEPCGKEITTSAVPTYGMPGPPGDLAMPDDPVAMVVMESLRVSSLPILPTHVRMWVTLDGKVANGGREWDVPVALMVENADTPAPATGSFAPFEMPRAKAPSSGLSFELGAAWGGLSVMGPTYVVPVVVTNVSDHAVQVDRSLFAATASGANGGPMTGVTNDTGRPMLSWAPAFFFCAREVRGALPFPDHVILAPTQHTSGVLCFTGDQSRPAREWADSPPHVALTFGAPQIFRRDTQPDTQFLGVYLPASPASR